MSNQSNMIGRAYEYICISTLNEEINKIRLSEIEKNSSFNKSRECWESINLQMQKALKQSAITAIYAIFDLEPMVLEKGNDKLILKLQKDSKGEIGDVRDIIILRRDLKWEIGLSIKHNHFAVKHSRLGKTLDFGNKWFGVKCSEQYWNEVGPIFSYLNNEKMLGTNWRDLPHKEKDVYVPLLKAFIEEIKRSYQKHPELPKRLVEYLLGEYDFYKVISIDKRKITKIQTYNLRGTLNKATRNKKPKTIIPISNLPTRMVAIDFKPLSTSTVELYLDNGWQFSFRIHNASTKVETSLKFDIQIIGMPSTIISLECLWNKD